MNKLYLFLLLIIIVGTKAYAEPTPHLMRGLRPLGMGNAFVAVSDDENALFYNPAGLDDVKIDRVEIVNPIFELSTSVIEVMLDVVDTAGNSDDSDADQTEEIVNLANEHMGKPAYLRIMLSPGYTRRNFAIKVFPGVEADLNVRNRVFPNIEFNGKFNFGMGIGFAQGYKDKLLQVGVAVKPVYRIASGDQVLGIQNINSFNETIQSFDNRGFLLGADIGLKSHWDTLFHMWDVPYLTDIAAYTRPRVGIVFQSQQLELTGDTDKDRSTLAMGGAMNFDFWKLENIFALDIREINQPTSLWSKVSMGVESWLGKKRIIGGRLGLNQFRPTIGGTLDFKFFKGDLAAYYEEVGELIRQKGDLRVALQATFGW